MAHENKSTRVLQHASASLTVWRRHARSARTCSSVKCNPVGTSNNMFTIYSSVHSLLICNSPQNLPLRPAPNPGSRFLDLDPTTKGPDNLKSFRFGRPAMISRICVRSTPEPPALMVNDVTDCGNLPGKDVLDDEDVVFMVKAINHGVCFENFSGAPQCPPSKKRRSSTQWAGLSSGTGKVLSHLTTSSGEKMMVWKRCRRNDGTQYLDTSEYDWRDLLSLAASLTHGNGANVVKEEEAFTPLSGWCFLTHLDDWVGGYSQENRNPYYSR